MQSFGQKSLTRAVAFIPVLVMAAVASAEVTWEKTLPAAIKHATASKTPIFIDMYAEWCGPCKMLEKDVFSDPKVQKLMRRATASGWTSTKTRRKRRTSK